MCSRDVPDNQGPTWWHSCQLPIEKHNSDADNGTMCTLFEYFKVNAEHYALLRVSCSDGAQAYQRTFSNDALFPAGKTLLDTLSDCSDAEDNKGRSGDNLTSSSSICVSKVGPPPTIRVSCNVFTNPVHICIGQPMSLSNFTCLVTRYFSYLHHELEVTQQDLQKKRETHAQLVAGLRKSVSEKVRFDKMLRFGTAVLMREKRKCPNRQSTTGSTDGADMTPGNPDTSKR